MSRDYVFTAWTQPEYDESKCRYLCYGIERCPTTDREHWQGFVIFNRTHRIPGAKRNISVGDGCHFESRRGTRQQAVDYCRKCGNFSEWGRLETFNQKELLYFPIKEIKNLDPLFYVRYHKGIEKFKINEGEKWRDINVEWIWGEAGSGKTKSAMNYEDVYKLDSPYIWWDGYDEQKILLIDDYIDGVIPQGMLLNILDGYRLRLPTKGGHTYAQWNKIIITSNEDPRKMMCWSKALERRVSSVIHLRCDCASG